MNTFKESTLLQAQRLQRKFANMMTNHAGMLVLQNLRVARLQNEVGSKSFFDSRIFSQKSAEISPMFFEPCRIIIRGGTVTRGYRSGYVSDMYPSPF